jgi:preprotein translocase subunit SecA
MVSLKKIFGSANDRLIKQYRQRVAVINGLAEEFAGLNDEALQGKTALFKERIAQGESLDSLLVEAFATVREAATRTLGLRHYDVQLIGGMVLHHGRIAEMKTGEGKTLVATLAVYLNALEGKGVHVVTVNDYLARRDAQWMSNVYNFLGLNVGIITHNMHDYDRKAAYGADITYGTNNEFGFDYLRDNMKFSREMMVQRPFNFAVIDEVDSILIDEARTPLIISGATEDNSELYVHINGLVKKLDDSHYEIDEKSRSVTLNDEGTAEMERLLAQRGFIREGESLYDIDHVGLVHHVTNALKAHKLFQAEVDYIVKDGKVIIIDEFTGRMMEGRRFSDGLHQALEAKEHAQIQNENQTLASITFQNYFRMYPKLAGMTGTALTEANEFADIYKLEVVEIPTHVPVARRDNDDIIYRTRAEKYLAVVQEIARAYAKGQPVLVGTVSIEQSELISAMLKDRKVFVKLAELTQERMKKLGADTKYKEDYAAMEESAALLMSLAKQNPPVVHQVLNARHHAQEANIVAEAGRPKAVTIATNMAGRGTDIKLGGNLEVRISIEAEGLEGAAREAKIAALEAEIERDRQLVLEAGGLYVIGTERHESRRIDNQLRGRSGRQGDPGESTFFISLEDDLMRIFGSERIDGMLQKFGLKEGDAIIHPWMNKALERAQAKVEARNYDIRKNLLKFDDVMNDQRKVIYEQRRDLMDSEDVSETITDMRHDLNAQVVALHIPPKSYANAWDTEALHKELYHLYGLSLPITQWAEEEGVGYDEILARLNVATDAQIQEKCTEYSEKIMRMVEKRLLLETLDTLWKDHLLSLDHLRAGIGLRAYGQRDPLNEYKQEAFTLFEHMLASLREQVTMHLAHLRISVQHPPATLEEKAKRMPPMHEGRSDPALEAETSAPIYALPRVAPEDRDPMDESTWGRVGRNELCPCGSGKKYKHCHGIMHAQVG